MRTTARTFLIHKTHLKQKALTLRVPQHIHEALHSVKEQAESAGYVFDVQAAVVEALEKALTIARQELEQVEQGEPVCTPRRRRKMTPANGPSEDDRRGSLPA